MAQKRSRATFESDPSTIFYGTPLPPFDPDVRDDGSYVPLWKQDATDDRGRKRFHGAFTGGFSAGYFNSVGSKEGWAPATFVSSRTNRAKDRKETATQKAEDFMDAEDIADLEESKILSTAGAYAGIGSTADDALRKNTLLDLMQPSNSIGVRLLQKMGWKEGQGIGPKIRRQPRAENRQSATQEAHWFAPENTQMINFMKKTDNKGLGYTGEAASLASAPQETNIVPDQDDDSSILARSKARFNQSSKAKKSNFGVGVLNDTGSDDEDPFAMGPKLSYNRIIGPVKKPKKPKQTANVVSSNPLLSTKPIFLSKKKLTTNLRKCHDGRLPLDAFVLSNPVNLSISPELAPPKVPEDWKSSKVPRSSAENQSSGTYQSTTVAARSSSLNPASRASLLGETILPGKSVFSFLDPSARARLVSATNNQNLPAAGSEPVPAEYAKSETDRVKTLWSRVPALDPSLAKSALARVDFMPYADDLPKRARYRSFLERVATSSAELPSRAEGHSVDDWAAEMREFAQAAAVFRPMSGMMASRFTSSSGSAPKYEGGEDLDDGENLLKRPAQKPEDPAEQAAKMGMFGIMTRSVVRFTPTRLVCKRFGVEPPPDVDPGVDDEAGGEESRVEQPVSNEVLEKMKMETFERKGNMVDSREMYTWGDSMGQSTVKIKSDVLVDTEKNQALEQERPGDAVFAAIFGSDDEDD